MNIFEKVLLQNIEIEGILRVLSSRPSKEAFDMLADKFNKFAENITIINESADRILSANTTLVDSIAAAEDAEKNIEPEQPATPETTVVEVEIKTTMEEVDQTPEPKEEQNNLHATLDEISELFFGKPYEVLGGEAAETEKKKEAEEKGAPEATSANVETDNYDIETTLIQDIFNNEISADDTPKTEPETTGATEAKPAAAAQMQSASWPQVINDKLLKSFNINDKYLFIREIFNNDPTAFKNAIDKISGMDSLGEAFNYMLNDLELDSSKESVKSFIQAISSYFNS